MNNIAGSHLHGSYRYALFESYGLNRSNIELIYIIGYTSSLVIGTFAASLTDVYGRRLGCLLTSVFFILMSILKNFSSIWILIISGIFSGIADVFHLTVFDAWLLQEYRERSLDDTSLKRILRDANVGLAFVSIGAGVFAQVLVERNNYVAPFNMSIVFFTLSIIFIWKFWSENYGNKDAKATHSFILAIQILRADPRIVVLGLCIASFEASLFLFIMNWTPVLERTRSSTDQNPLPLGFIFAGYMSLILVLTGFILFEFCVGIYTPSITVFNNAYIPNETRSTVLCYVRVPQMIILLTVLLAHFSITMTLVLCVLLNLVAMLCVIILRGLKLPEEEVYVNETEILLEKSSSPLNGSSSSASLTLQHSAKSKDEN
ncbi:unnamed protein product [Adineta steineri]|uniref:Molybdate-anion transporter n=1 Tax=Adineta steineri TaxID=433720 RepID=A0A814UJ40_9BILA|nr:unnamed protein product [Adineta steineri]CAF1229688.1 unnamed protein product [Adineta steineri]CAF3820469.1 unnamed protein product [Adineta steineri]CAF3905129.1 unnamed protein product [Adineta steineri]